MKSLARHVLPAVLTAAALLAAPVMAHAQSAPPKVVKRAPLDFPDEAIRKGVDRGVLKVNVTVDSAGSVTEVKVVEAFPVGARILNSAAIESINKWKFEGSGKTASFDMQVVLSAD